MNKTKSQQAQEYAEKYLTDICLMMDYEEDKQIGYFHTYDIQKAYSDGYTACEQSANLIAKGISADNASYDLCTTPIGNGVRGIVRTPAQPIFTLAAICSLLPKEIEIDAHRCGLDMWYHNAHYWMVSYVQFDGAEIAYQSPVVSRDRLIDALYEFLCLCIRNGYIDLTK